MSLDVAKARLDTPGCNNVIHFNNAGASLMPQPVVDATTGFLQLEANIGAYEAAQQQRHQLENPYYALAKLLGCLPSEIAIQENATRAWQMAFYSIPFKSGERILTSIGEYSSNYLAMQQLAARIGVKVELLPGDENGNLSLNALRNSLDSTVKLIAITHIPSNDGIVHPVEEVGRISKEAGILYLLDACQSAGQLPLDVAKIGCDFLSATARKYLRGPRGTGFLYVRRELIEQTRPPFIELHNVDWIARDSYNLRPDARRFETWEMSYATKIGLGVAVDYALSIGINEIWQRVQELATYLRLKLCQLTQIELRDTGEVKSGIVTFTVAGKEPEAVKAQLSSQGINLSISQLDYARLNMEPRNLTGLLRASLHYFNTHQEIDTFIANLSEICGGKSWAGHVVRPV